MSSSVICSRIFVKGVEKIPLELLFLVRYLDFKLFAGFSTSCVLRLKILSVVCDPVFTLPLAKNSYSFITDIETKQASSYIIYINYTAFLTWINVKISELYQHALHRIHGRRGSPIPGEAPYHIQFSIPNVTPSQKYPLKFVYVTCGWGHNGYCGGELHQWYVVRIQPQNWRTFLFLFATSFMTEIRCRQQHNCSSFFNLCY